MTPADLLDHARAEWAAGRGAKAVALAWDAVNRAMDRGSAEILSQAAELAEAIAAADEGRSAREARQLADYCRHCLAGVGNGTQSESLLALVTGWRRRRRCPDCGESIAKDARVCPHCGYRMAPPPR